jgi:hypothetical protein
MRVIVTIFLAGLVVIPLASLILFGVGKELKAWFVLIAVLAAVVLIVHLVQNKKLW